MENTFDNGSTGDNRRILIKIDSEHIEFFYLDQYLRKRNWIDEMEDKARNGECEELEDEDKEINGFYWIFSSEWESDKTNRLDRPDNWHTHMKEKIWFTSDMEKFINENTNIEIEKIIK